MVDSLRDQLLKSGIAKLIPRSAQPDPVPGKAPDRRQRTARKPHHKADPAAHEMDLAKAYALRAKAQNRERREVEQAAAEAARLRRERKTKIRQLLAGKALNKTDAEQARHFEYAGKIRRIYVDAEQLRALNAGALGIVQHDGHYLLVAGEIVRQVRELDARHVALLIEPGSAAVGDDGVPDDLMW